MRIESQVIRHPYSTEIVSEFLNSDIVAVSEVMRDLVILARQVALVDSTILITGETGTGKERMARIVHQESSRSLGEFVAVNCGAIPEGLLESELFGHAKGSFTGAVSDRPGLFEAANHGTLLLDEIAEISPGMQLRLLRALQEREIRRVGENRVRPVDVRIIASTNRNLAQDLVTGRFREDLYYRLNVIELNIPPLRERPQDILPLAFTLLREASLRLKRQPLGISAFAAEQILHHKWPGNVRELQNAMERAVVLARPGQTEIEVLSQVFVPVPQPIHPNSSIYEPSIALSLEDVERNHILAVLKINGGNQTRTAAQLGIGSATLYRKLKHYTQSPNVTC